MWFSFPRQARAKPTRDNHRRLYELSRPNKLARIPCKYAGLRTNISLGPPLSKESKMIYFIFLFSGGLALREEWRIKNEKIGKGPGKNL